LFLYTSATKAHCDVKSKPLKAIKVEKPPCQTGADYSSQKRLETIDPNSILGPFQVDGTNRPEFGGRQDEDFRREFRFNNQLRLKYNKVFDDLHTVSAGAYTEYIKSHLYFFGFNQFGIDARQYPDGSGFIDPATREVIGGQEINPYLPNVFSSQFEEGLFSYFASGDYDYDRKYGFSATIRRDATFRFEEDNRWGTFYSVGARWNIEQESFMENTPFNLLKLRASYGTQGNQRIVNAEFSALNLTRSLYGIGGGYNNTPGTVPTQIGVADLRWEDITLANVGFDFGLNDNKLFGSLDFYQKTTTNLYQNTPVSPVNATTALQTNIGELRNRGIELALTYNVLATQDWRIKVSANGSYNKNEVIELPDSFDGLNFVGGSTALIEGSPINTFYTVPYLGANPANGSPLFRTIDGGVTETLLDEDRIDSGKSAFPVWQGGFSTLIAFKGFDFTSQWAFVADVYRNNLDLAGLEETVPDSGNNRSVTVLDEWREVGDITSVPRANSGLTSVDYINSSDRYLEDASYLRMRNIAVGYNFQDVSLDKIGIDRARIYVQGENLLTFTGYNGLDPEGGYRTTDRGVYPTPSIYTMGINLTF